MLEKSIRHYYKTKLVFVHFLCVCVQTQTRTVFVINHSKNTSFNYLYKRQILKVISCLAETVRTQLWFNYFEVCDIWRNSKYKVRFNFNFPRKCFCKNKIRVIL